MRWHGRSNQFSSGTPLARDQRRPVQVGAKRRSAGCALSLIRVRTTHQRSKRVMRILTRRGPEPPRIEGGGDRDGGQRFAMPRRNRAHGLLRNVSSARIVPAMTNIDRFRERPGWWVGKGDGSARCLTDCAPQTAGRMRLRGARDWRQDARRRDQRRLGSSSMPITDGQNSAIAGSAGIAA
jgi:hypothetical protein